jgi:hypothetical protein
VKLESCSKTLIPYSVLGDHLATQEKKNYFNPSHIRQDIATGSPQISDFAMNQ